MVVKNAEGTDIRFENPGRLLLVVIAFIFWGIGFLDLLGHTSAEAAIFGLYSLPFFILILLYGSTLAILIVLFFNSRILSRVEDSVRYVQSRTWLAVSVLIGLGIVLWVVLEWDRWQRFPGLQFAAFGLVLLAACILLIANWSESKGQQRWRKVIVYPLAALIIIEVIIQLLAWFSLLPGVQTIGGDFIPYERIYYNAEGFRNDFANRNGWTYPNVPLEEDVESFLIVGGSFVQALQVLPEEQLSAQLTALINRSVTDAEGENEVISIGLPGFGLSPFLFDEVIERPNLINYDELIILFHLGDDFQSPSPSNNAIMYTLDDDGNASVQPNDVRLRHDLTHYYLRGVISFQVVETIRSNYLTPKVITNLVRDWVGETPVYGESSENDGSNFSRLSGYVVDEYTLTEPGHAGIKSTDQELIQNGNNFIYKHGGSAEMREAIAIADSVLEATQETASANDITLRLVTIPVFPETFYSTYQSGDWKPQVGDYDLFSPEEALMEIAEKHSIPILPMGQRMIADRLTVEEIKSLYFSNGLGHLTSKGHRYFAESIYSCFYTEAADQFCVK